jgi:LuxR family maltose regulon positive regulatory protein
MLRRPRLNAMIEQGLQYPLLVVQAGPGYGKTQAMADYVSVRAAKVLWIRLGGHDNLRAHFWAHLIRAIEQVFPETAGLYAAAFPSDPASLDAFARTLQIRFADYKEVIWVFDDFGTISDQAIINFLWALADMDLEGFRLVFITNSHRWAEPAAFSGRRSLLLRDDLRFAKDEINELYRLHGVALDPDEVERINSFTEGWPLALHLLALQRKAPESAAGSATITDGAVLRLFEGRFFRDYSERQRKALIRLSLLNTFTREIAAELYEGNRADLEGLWNHSFVDQEESSGKLVFHRMCRSFLRDKQYLLDAEEARDVWRIAARRFETGGDAMEAIACCRNCGDHIGVLRVIREVALSQFGISEQTAAYFIEHLEPLTPEDGASYLTALGLRALILMTLGRLDEAEDLALDLERRLIHSRTPEARASLGSVNIIRGFIHMLNARDDFAGYFKTAAGYLSREEIPNTETGLRIHNQHSFSMSDNLPGAKERMEAAVRDAAPWMRRLFGGGMAGMEHIFSAEAAYLSYRMKDARQHAYRGIYEAQANAQHDLVCNGFLLLARAALMRGDYAETARQIQNITAYADRYDIDVLRDIRDTALAWYYIRLRDPDRVPKNITTAHFLRHPVLTYTRADIVYGNYLACIGEFAQLIGVMEQVRQASPDIVTQDGVSKYILLAIGQYHLGNEGTAVKAFWTAYNMCRHNDLTTPFIEGEQHTRALIALARGQKNHAFSAEWLNLIGRHVGSYGKRIASVRAAYRRSHSAAESADSPLSKRETLVLQALSQGLTREEIASVQYISVNTVKSAIRSIYTKLNVSNRMEAVSVAIARGYISNHTLE